MRVHIIFQRSRLHSQALVVPCDKVLDSVTAELFPQIPHNGTLTSVINLSHVENHFPPKSVFTWGKRWKSDATKLRERAGWVNSYYLRSLSKNWIICALRGRALSWMRTIFLMSDLCVSLLSNFSSAVECQSTSVSLQSSSLSNNQTQIPHTATHDNPDFSSADGTVLNFFGADSSLVFQIIEAFFNSRVQKCIHVLSP